MSADMGKIIHDARTARGLTQKELSELSGVSRESICGYERGIASPTLCYIEWILEALGLEIEIKEVE